MSPVLAPLIIALTATGYILIHHDHFNLEFGEKFNPVFFGTPFQRNTFLSYHGH